MNILHIGSAQKDGLAKSVLATQNTEFIDPAPAFGAGGKNSKVSVGSVAKPTKLDTLYILCSLAKLFPQTLLHRLYYEF